MFLVQPQGFKISVDSWAARIASGKENDRTSAAWKRHVFNAKIDLLNKATIAFICSLAAALLGMSGPLTFLGFIGSLFMNWQVTKSLALHNHPGSPPCFPNEDGYVGAMRAEDYPVSDNYFPVQVDIFGVIAWGNPLKEVQAAPRRGFFNLGQK